MGYLAHYVGTGNDVEAQRMAARLKAVLPLSLWRSISALTRDLTVLIWYWMT